MTAPDTDGHPKSHLNRRNFIWSAASSAAALQVPAAVSADVLDTERVSNAGTAAERQTVELRINRRPFMVSLDSRTTLLDAIRDHAGLTGTKKGCAHGQCGACTVHIDGKRALSCMTFAVMSQGHEITTIEGLSEEGGALHPMQQAFIDCDALQCGYCTPGQIMAAVACVAEGNATTLDDIREYMSGNLCRCAAYPNIVAAIAQASAAMKVR